MGKSFEDLFQILSHDMKEIFSLILKSLFILTIKIKDSEDISYIKPYFKLNKRIKSLI